MGSHHQHHRAGSKLVLQVPASGARWARLRGGEWPRVAVSASLSAGHLWGSWGLRAGGRGSPCVGVSAWGSSQQGARVQCMGEAGAGGRLSHPYHSSCTLPPEHTQIILQRARAEAGRALGEWIGSGVRALGDAGAGGDLALRWVHAAAQLVGGAGSLAMQLLPPVPSAAEHTKAGRQRVRGGEER